MAFPNNPSDGEEVVIDGRVWTYNTNTNQWKQTGYGVARRSDIEDVGFAYDATEEKWRLDVGQMVNA